MESHNGTGDEVVPSVHQGISITPLRPFIPNSNCSTLADRDTKGMKMSTLEMIKELAGNFRNDANVIIESNKAVIKYGSRNISLIVNNSGEITSMKYSDNDVYASKGYMNVAPSADNVKKIVNELMTIDFKQTQGKPLFKQSASNIWVTDGGVLVSLR